MVYEELLITITYFDIIELPDNFELQKIEKRMGTNTSSNIIIM